MNKKPKIVLFLRALNTGGAQQQVVALLKGLEKCGFHLQHEWIVMVFYEGGIFFEEVKNFKWVRLVSLRKKSRWDLFGFMWKLICFVRQEKPDVIYSFLPVPNILNAVLKILFPKIKAVWGIRTSERDYKRYDWLTRLTVEIERYLSRIPDSIVANSAAGINFLQRRGFLSRRMMIPNGIDSERFKPDLKAGEDIRHEFGLSKNNVVIGMVGRIDPVKGYELFLRAASLFYKKNASARFLCVGEGSEDYTNHLGQLADELGISKAVIWTGTRNDLPNLYNALDIYTSASLSEGFSNTMGEAMACGIPCVVSNVGDASEVVIDGAGIVVPPGDPTALTIAWKQALQGKRNASNGREHVLKSYDISQLATRTVKALWPKV